MSTNQNDPNNPNQKNERLVFIPQSKVENQLSQTIKQYADAEGIQIHDVLLEALLHLAVEKDIFNPSACIRVKKQKCTMKDCKDPVRYEALYKPDNTVKLLCYCHGHSIAYAIQRGNTKLWVYSRPLTTETAPANSHQGKSA